MSFCRFITQLKKYLHFQDESVQDVVPLKKDIFLQCICSLCRNNCSQICLMIFFSPRFHRITAFKKCFGTMNKNKEQAHPVVEIFKAIIEKNARLKEAKEKIIHSIQQSLCLTDSKEHLCKSLSLVNS